MSSNKSKEAISLSAKALFLKYGIRKITVEEICEHAKVSKMTFYRHFTNKNHIAKHVLSLIFDENRNKYRSIMMDSIPFKKKVEKIIALKADKANAISDTFLNDIYHPTAQELQSHITAYQKEMNIEVRNDFEKAQRNGDIRSDISLNLILYLLNDLQAKIKDDKLMAMYDSIQDASVELTRFFFYGILNPAVPNE